MAIKAAIEINDTRKMRNKPYFLLNMFTLLRDATLALYADTVFPRRLLVAHVFEISDKIR